MQQSPCFNLYSPDENGKLFPSFQRFNNCLCSPRTLFFGLGLSSSGQNSYSKKNILSKMKFSSSNTKQIINNSSIPPIFLSKKRNFSTESIEKNNIKNSNNKNINKTNQVLNTNTIIINDETVMESQPDIKKTKASSKKNSTYIPQQCGDGNNNYYNNNYNYGFNYGCISNSSLVKFHKSAYIGSVKKNLLPSLSKELRSNSKNNINEQRQINNKNNYSSTSMNKKLNYNSEDKNMNSCSKSNLNSSNKKSINDSSPYDYLCRTTESLDLEKMVDYIVSSTKIYNRYNDNNNKENYSNNLINYNDLESGNFNIKNSEKKGNLIFNNNNSNKKIFNSQIDNQKTPYSLCKCKKVECLKYSCSCLKSGNKCSNLCSCLNCKNKESKKFKIYG